MDRSLKDLIILLLKGPEAWTDMELDILVARREEISRNLEKLGWAVLKAPLQVKRYRERKKELEAMPTEELRGILSGIYSEEAAEHMGDAVVPVYEKTDSHIIAKILEERGVTAVAAESVPA